LYLGRKNALLACPPQLLGREKERMKLSGNIVAENSGGSSGRRSSDTSEQAEVAILLLFCVLRWHLGPSLKTPILKGDVMCCNCN
jgi:hypothetical protein